MVWSSEVWPSIGDKLMSRVVKMENGCWEYNGGHIPPRYGQIWWDGKIIGAHRVGYELGNGPIPDGKCVLHRCDNPPCVNPDHLFLGTQQDNADDKVAKGRWKNGAKLTESDVREIRRLIRLGSLYHWEIAERFGVSIATIGAVKSGYRWSHVPESTLPWRRQIGRRTPALSAPPDITSQPCIIVRRR